MLGNYSKLVGVLTNESDRVRFTAPVGKTVGTYKAWLQNHDGKSVDTLQASFPDDTGDIHMPWAPANRVINARSTYATFDDSRRDYRGVKVLASDNNTIVVTNDSQVWAHTTNVRNEA